MSYVDITVYVCQEIVLVCLVYAKLG